MITALFILGVVVIVFGVITGFLTGSLLGFLISIFGTAISAITLFALAKVLENQNTIIFKLEKQDEKVKSQENMKKKEMEPCTKCNYEFEVDRTSCPQCGYRKEQKVKNRWPD